MCRPRNRERPPPSWSEYRAAAACGPCSGDGERTQPALANSVSIDRDIPDRGVDRLRQHRGRQLAAAAIGHRHELDPGAGMNNSLDKCGEPPGPVWRIVDLARLSFGGPRSSPSLSSTATPHAPPEADSSPGISRPATKSFDRIVAGLRLHRRDHRHRAGVADHQRVAVGLRRRDFARGERAARSGAILDHGRLAELRQNLRGEPRHRVVRPARRRRHDDADRLRGIVLRMRLACRAAPSRQKRTRRSVVSLRIIRPFLRS